VVNIELQSSVALAILGVVWIACGFWKKILKDSDRWNCIGEEWHKTILFNFELTDLLAIDLIANNLGTLTIQNTSGISENSLLRVKIFLIINIKSADSTFCIPLILVIYENDNEMCWNLL
jgi:hypothetical protein